MSAEPTELTLAALSARVGVPARTIRDYQRRGLLPRPEIRGRLGIYREADETRLRLIQTLKAQGLTLASISALIAQEADLGAAVATVRAEASRFQPATDELLPLDPSVLQELRALDAEVLDVVERMGWVVRRGSAWAASAEVMSLLRALLQTNLSSTALRQVLTSIHSLTASVERITTRLNDDDEALIRAIVRSLVDRSLTAKDSG